MSKRLLLIISFVMTIATIAVADTVIGSDTAAAIQTENGYTKTTKKQYANYLGFAGGVSTGSGISYRHWLNPQWGFQINLLPYYNESTQRYSNYYYNGTYNSISRNDSTVRNVGFLNLGLTALRTAAAMDYLRVLLYMGGNLYTDYLYTDEWDSYSSSRTIYNSLTNKVTLGFGGGCEFYLWRLAFHAMVGVQGSIVAETMQKAAGMSFEGGVHFRF